MGNPSQFAEFTNRNSKNPYDVEHILPDAFDDYSAFFADEREFKEYRQRLGNLIILTKDHNRSYQAMKYETKVSHYMSDNIMAQAMNSLAYQNNPLFIPIANRLGIKPYEHMTKDTIVERQKMYLALSKEIWSENGIYNIIGGWTKDEFDSISFETASKIIDRDDGITGDVSWVIPGNLKYFDVVAAFNELHEIEWSQHANFKKGDIVYIYLSYPRAEIAYKCRVNEANIPSSARQIDDSKFYKVSNIIDAEKYMRLEVLRSYPEGTLTRDMLLEKGVTTNFQGPTKVRNELAEALTAIDNA